MSIDTRELFDGIDVSLLSFDPSELEGLSLEEAEQRLIDAEMADLEQLDTIARNMPLAVVPLWVRSQEHIDQLPDWVREEMRPDEPDQRELAIAMLTYTITVAGGGNRGGKTFDMICVLIALALGSDHPMVEAWMELNRIPAHLVPRSPGKVYLVARSASVSRDHHRNVVDSLLPRSGKKWIHKNALSEAYVEVDCPGYEEKGRITFKSIDQDEDKFRAIEGRAFGVDEEPVGPEGKKKFKEMKRAVSAQSGRVIIAATTQDGETWLVEMTKDPSQCYAGNLDAALNYLAEDPAGILNNLASMEPWERQMRRFGEPVSNKQRIYPSFKVGDRDRYGRHHVCEPFDIPEDWPRFLAADFGTRAPTAVVWGAVGDDQTIYIYREWVKPGLTWAQHADIVHQLMGHERDENGRWRAGVGEVLQMAWGDPKEPDAIKQWRKENIPIRKAYNAVQPGIDCVRDFMRVQVDGRSRFKVFSDCTGTIKCLQNYQWNEQMRGQVPLKKDDHEADAVRYLCMGIAARWLR